MALQISLQSTTHHNMQVLVLLALVAVASTRPQSFNDDVFHFSTLNGQKEGRSFGFQPAAFTSPVFVAAQPTFAPTFAVQPTFAPTFAPQPAFAVQPAFAKQAVAVKQYSTAPVYPTFAARSEGAGSARILKYINEFDPLGFYRVNFETENGIAAVEQGSLTKGASSEEGSVKEGSFSYTGDNGVLYTVNYVADENGFRASGEHLPTPPPIPAEILRSLEINAASNEKYDDKGRLL